MTTVKEVLIPGLSQQRFWRFYFLVYSSVSVSIERIYQTLETGFHRLYKHFEFRKINSTGRRVFNSLLGVCLSRWNTACLARVQYITSGYLEIRKTTPFRVWYTGQTQTFLSSWSRNELRHNRRPMVSGPNFCFGVKSWCRASAPGESVRSMITRIKWSLGSQALQCWSCRGNIVTWKI